MYPQCKAPTRCTILCIKDVLPSSILLLESKDGQKCREHFKDCIPYHFPIEGSIHLEVDVPHGLLCFVCGEKKGTSSILLCNHCQYRWHMVCLTSPHLIFPFLRLDLSSNFTKF